MMSRRHSRFQRSLFTALGAIVLAASASLPALVLPGTAFGAPAATPQETTSEASESSGSSASHKPRAAHEKPKKQSKLTKHAKHAKLAKRDDAKTGESKKASKKKARRHADDSSSAPVAKATDAKATVAKATDAKAANVKAPDAKAPDAKAPSAKAPDAKKSSRSAKRHASRAASGATRSRAPVEPPADESENENESPIDTGIMLSKATPSLSAPAVSTAETPAKPKSVTIAAVSKQIRERAAESESAEAKAVAKRNERKAAHSSKSASSRPTGAKKAKKTASRASNAKRRSGKGDAGDKEAPRKPCLGPAITVDRAGLESARFPLVDCEGAPLEGARERLSILARPWGVAHPGDIRKQKPSTRGKAKTAAAQSPLDVAPHVRRLDKGLLSRIDAIARKFPGKTISLVSGYRPQSRGSLHQSARAIDLRVLGVANEDLVSVCRTLHDTGCGYYPNSSFVHVDVRLPGTGTVTWIDASGPGEPPRYVTQWPLPESEPPPPFVPPGEGKAKGTAENTGTPDPKPSGAAATSAKLPVADAAPTEAHGDEAGSPGPSDASPTCAPCAEKNSAHPVTSAPADAKSKPGARLEDPPDQ